MTNNDHYENSPNQPPQRKKQGSSSANKLKSLYGIQGAQSMKAVFAPLDRIKIVVQSQPRHPDIEKKNFKGLFGTFSRLLREQKPQKSILTKPLILWRGNLANIVRTIPTTMCAGALFTIKRMVFNMLSSQNKQPLSLSSVVLYQSLAGVIAGGIILPFVYPFDLARTRITADVGFQRHYGKFPGGIIRCFRRTISEEGFFSLYNGCLAALLGTLVYRASYFGFYALGKGIIVGNTPQQKNIFLKLFFISQSTTILAMYTVYPIDTIRRRRMISGMKYQRVYSGSIIDVTKRLIKEEGILSFWGGASANIIRTTFSALLLVIFDIFSS